MLVISDSECQNGGLQGRKPRRFTNDSQLSLEIDVPDHAVPNARAVAALPRSAKRIEAQKRSQTSRTCAPETGVSFLQPTEAPKGAERKRL